MRVLADFHHHALLQSLILLFENRLGGELYRPIGMEWYEQDYWKVWDHPATAAQYLSLDQLYHPIDGTPPLNQIIEQEKGIYLCHDIGEEIPNKAIDLETFKTMKFDYLIASIPQHIAPFRKLIAAYQPQAKLILQVGNAWSIDQSQAALIDGVMASAKIQGVLGYNGAAIPIVQYHQEFDLDTFHYAPILYKNRIYSFINCLNTVDIYRKDWELFQELETLMPDWEFKSFGGQCRDGSISDAKLLANKMREATFIFHCKTDGDGYGHVIHNAAAVGRPLITRISDYRGKLAEPLINADTAIIVDNPTPREIAEYIKKIDGNCIYMGEQINNKFKEVVDFDREELQIRAFLDKLA